MTRAKERKVGKGPLRGGEKGQSFRRAGKIKPYWGKGNGKKLKSSFQRKVTKRESTIARGDWWGDLTRTQFPSFTRALAKSNKKMGRSDKGTAIIT